jgi:hypothetical protein
LLFGNSWILGEGLAEGFFCAEIEGHEDLDGDAAAAMVEFLDANNFAERFLIDGAWGIGIGEGDKDAHTGLVGAVFGNEIDAVEGGVLGGKDFVELGEAGFRRADANNAWQLQAAFAAAFFNSQARHILLWAHWRVLSQEVSRGKVPECKRAKAWAFLGAGPGHWTGKKLDPFGAAGHQVG